MKRSLLLVLLCLTWSLGMAQDKPLYRFYTSEGKASSYADVVKAAQKADVVLFGELHNQSVCHWLQMQLAKDLKAAGRPLVLALEMLEADDQVALNEYLKGRLSDSQWESEAKLWPNYKTDYKPLVTWAKAQGVAVVASNIPRRYAAMVSKRGPAVLDSLGAEAQAWLMPKPWKVDTALSTYREMRSMFGGGHGGFSADKMIAAQASKDATMAWRSLQGWKPGHVLLHLNGAFHNKKGEGIGAYLKQYRPGLKILTIYTETQADLNTLEESHKGQSDFLLVLPDDAPVSH